MIAWCGSDYPVESQCSFSAVSVQFRCNFKLWSLFWRRSCGLRSHCGPTAVPLRFQCGSSAVFRLQVAPERRFLPPVASPTLHPPPPLLFTHTHTQTTSTIIIIIVIHLNKLEVNLKCSMAFARPTISWTGSIATPPLSLLLPPPSRNEFIPQPFKRHLTSTPITINPLI